MFVLATFRIDENLVVEIVMPHLDNTYNYYVAPTLCHPFDEVTALLKINNNEIMLCIDASIEIFRSLHGGLQHGLRGNMMLPDHIKVGSLGFLFNKNTYQSADDDSVNFSLFWLWSSSTVQSWLYSRNNVIYLEISPIAIHGYTIGQPFKKQRAHISFDRFMQAYASLIVIEINKALAQKWLDDSNHIIDDLEQVFSKNKRAI